MAPTDEDLVMRCAAGDQESFLMLHDRFAPRVFGLLIKIIGQRTEAEDVLQEVMWEAWTRSDRYNRSLGSVAAWLLMIARSRGIDAVRRLRGLKSSMVTLPDESAAAPVSETEGATATSPKIQAALSTLPPEQQVVIVMAFYRGLTREQIAEALNIPIGTVKTRIRLGVRRLAEQRDQLGLIFP